MGEGELALEEPYCTTYLRNADTQLKQGALSYMHLPFTPPITHFVAHFLRLMLLALERFLRLARLASSSGNEALATRTSLPPT
jgi:hypothetical protein